MSDLNHTTLVGRLTRDPELRRGPSGTPYATFTVASNRKWKSEGENGSREESAFVSCIAFGWPAEWAAQHRKGESVLVHGRLRTDSWEADGNTHSRLVLVVAELQFIQLVFGRKGLESTDEKVPVGKTGDGDVPF